MILIFPIPLISLIVLFPIKTFPPSMSSRSNKTSLFGVIWNVQPESSTHSSLVACWLATNTNGSSFSSAMLTEFDGFFLSGHCFLKCPSLPHVQHSLENLGLDFDRLLLLDLALQVLSFFFSPLPLLSPANSPSELFLDLLRSPFSLNSTSLE